MRIHPLLPCLALGCATVPHPAPSDASTRLKELSERYWDLNLQSAPLDWIGEQSGGPLVATSLGDHRFDDRLDDLSSAGRAKFLDALVGMEAEAKAIPDDELHGEDRLTKALFLDLLDSTREIQVCDADRWTVDQMNGPEVNLPLTAMYYPMTAKGVADLVARYGQVGRYFDQQIASLREGLAKGEVAPKHNVELTIAELDDLAKKDGAHSDFLPPPDKLAKLPEGERAADVARIAAAIDTTVVPALKKYRAFLHDVILPKARTDPGLWALPNGAACYAAAIRMQVGLRKTPEVLHQLGLELLAKIEAEQRAIAKAEGAPLKPDGTPDLKAFEKAIGQRPDESFKTGDELLAWARKTIARSMAALPRDFKTMPQRPLEVKAVEAWRAATAGAAFYQQAPDDGLTPAYYYVNTSDPTTRTLYDQECTVFHESVPGHHLQISIAQSLQGLPAFRRNGGSTGYVEGWALYTERLSDELGLYSGPLARYGMLAGQALRAVRLVVDTGLHAMHWSRQQALDFYLAHTTDPPDVGASEIDRYIVWPAQALGYMVGEQEIFALRAEAKRKLGAAFDIREFHDVILGHGALPLPVLEDEVHRWIASKLPASAAR
ncbi:MAG TPA: DUF885 domain-containing protein [Myxococcales bacterium]|nr:DUF885 domain-containing protein [Myxococcales bacterium]